MTLEEYIYKLYIPSIGKKYSKLMADKFNNDVKIFYDWIYGFDLDNFEDDLEIINYNHGIDWTVVKGFDVKMHRTITRYMNENCKTILQDLNNKGVF